MFFSGNLAVDPSQLTNIELHAPEGFFKKLMFTLFKSGGKKIEKETFTALAVLQELKNVFKSAGINNVVRLSQDDIDFYFDTEGLDNDFDEALSSYDLNTNEAYSSKFEHLNLILEHAEGSFKFLIDIGINRSHAVGKYPITINVSGLLKEFNAENGNEEYVKQKMSAIFADQKVYDQYLREKQLEFDQYLRRLEQNIRMYMKIDDLVADSQQKLVVPKEDAPKSSKDVAPRPNAPTTVFRGYPGYGGWLWYSMMWGSMCHSNDIHVHDTDLVTDGGEMIGSIGESGMDMGDSTLFNEDLSFEDRMGDNLEDVDTSGMDDIDGFDGMDGMDGGEMGGDFGGDIGGDAGGDGGWFDFGGDGGGFDLGGFDFGGFDF